jgi:hypothetical protein
LALDGEITDTKTFTDFQGFPSDLASDWLTLRAMAKDKDGVIYGIVFSDDSKETYFVKINLTTTIITYISTLGADNGNQYNSMAFIPNHTF